MKLYVTEYKNLVILDSYHLAQIPLEPPITEQVLDFTAGVVTSATFNPLTTIVRVECDATCSILFGQNPTATTSNQRFAANQVEYKGVTPSVMLKISVIANS